MHVRGSVDLDGCYLIMAAMRDLRKQRVSDPHLSHPKVHPGTLGPQSGVLRPTSAYITKASSKRVERLVLSARFPNADGPGDK